MRQGSTRGDRWEKGPRQFNARHANDPAPRLPRVVDSGFFMACRSCPAVSCRLRLAGLSITRMATTDQRYQAVYELPGILPAEVSIQEWSPVRVLTGGTTTSQWKHRPSRKNLAVLQRPGRLWVDTDRLRLAETRLVVT